MIKACYICGFDFEEDELVEVTVIAPWHLIESTITFSIGKPLDAYPDTLRHHQCPDPEQGDYENGGV